MKVEKICEQCGNQFKADSFKIKNGHGKYCSYKCSSISRKRRIKKICIQCKKKFEVLFSGNERKYCSYKCSSIGRRKRIKKICIQCGKEFEILFCDNEIKYCSRKCWRESKKAKLVEIECLQCKKIFVVYLRQLKSRIRKYCSRKCNSKALIGRKCSEETLEKRLFHTKENHWCWKGGRKEGYKRNMMNMKFRLNGRISNAIRQTLKNNSKNGRRTFDLLGYSIKSLEKHLNKTMPNGYTWRDFLDGKLHIDHIIPIKEFNYSAPDDLQFKECWALENLRLLPAKENIAKSDKLIKPYQICLNI